MSDKPFPPDKWDLRLLGWSLRPFDTTPPDRPLANFPILCDYRTVSAGRIASMNLHRQRVILLGVEGSIERAGLLAARFGDALPGDVQRDELAQRAKRIAANASALPRFRYAGTLLLDMFHRDARHNGHWLGLHPREFALLWYLAERPETIVSRRRLLEDVWRLKHEPGTNSVEVHMSRLRSKLATAGIRGLVLTDPAGGYRLAPEQQPGSSIMAWHAREPESRLDEYVLPGQNAAMHGE
ncbi:MAG: winged helix-turn-helix domain-containing protein [Caenibius sp.]